MKANSQSRKQSKIAVQQPLSDRLSSASQLKPQNLSSRSSKPLDVTSGKESESSKSKHSNSPQSTKKVSSLFKGLVFFVEVFTDKGQSQIESASKMIEQNGGKVSRQITKAVDYYIFENGRNQGLAKISTNQDFSNIKVVSPQWLTQSIDLQKLQPYHQYSLPDQEIRVQQALKEPTELQLSGKMSEARSQKRKVPSGRESEELSTSGVQSVTTSKRKAKAYAKSKFANDQGIGMIEEDSQSDIDEEDIEKIVKQVQEERFFRREFEKDLKKFAKLKAETDMNEEPAIVSRRQKREPKQLTKNQLIDSYIDGDIELPDFIEHMTYKLKAKKGKGAYSRKLKGMKRLTEMFRPAVPLKKCDQNHDDDEESESKDKMNKTAFVTLKDFLFDIDKENTPVKVNPGMIKQSHLNFTKVDHSKLNMTQAGIEEYQGQRTPFADVTMRIAKSSTFQPKSGLQESSQVEEQALPNQHQDQSYFFPVNFMLRRTQSYCPSKSFYQGKHPHDLRSPNKENLNFENQFDIQMNPCLFKSGHKPTLAHKKRKEWDKILPQRKLPSRVAKMNVSYVEDGMDEDKILGKLNKTKRRNIVNLY